MGYSRPQLTLLLLLAAVTLAGFGVREVYSEDDNLEAVFQYLVSK